MTTALHTALARTHETTRLATLAVWKGRAVVAGAWLTVWLILAAFAMLGPGLLMLSPVLLLSTVGLLGEAHAYEEKQRNGGG